MRPLESDVDEDGTTGLAGACHSLAAVEAGLARAAATAPRVLLQRGRGGEGAGGHRLMREGRPARRRTTERQHSPPWRGRRGSCAI